MNSDPGVKRFNLLLGLSLSGLFLFAFLVAYSLYIPLPSNKKPIIFYNSEKRDDLNHTLKKAVNSAQKSIILHTYTLSDPSLLSLLKKKAKQGIAVKLYYDKKASPSLECLNEKNMHFYPMKGKGLIHEKIWIIDEMLLFIGSANLTPSSLQIHDNLMLGLYTPPLAKNLLQDRPKEFHLEMEKRTIHYYSLPNQRALEALLDELDQAKKEVFLALFTFTHPQIVKKLIELHKRGVKIILKLDKGVANGAGKNTKKLLETEGIRVLTSQGVQLFHHKWAMIDKKNHILGSANWTRAAFNKNQDSIIIIKSIL